MILAVYIPFLVFLAAIAFAIMTAIGWWTARSRRIKLQEALQAIEPIESMTRNVYRTRNRKDCEQLNKEIDNWNRLYSKVTGYTMQPIDCSQFN